MFFFGFHCVFKGLFRALVLMMTTEIDINGKEVVIGGNGSNLL